MDGIAESAICYKGYLSYPPIRNVKCRRLVPKHNASFHLYTQHSIFLSCASNPSFVRDSFFSWDGFHHPSLRVVFHYVTLGFQEQLPPCLNVTRELSHCCFGVLRCFGASVLHPTLRLHPPCVHPPVPPSFFAHPPSVTQHSRARAVPGLAACSPTISVERAETARLGVGDGGMRDRTVVSSIA